MGECFFWYRPTRVVPVQRTLNGCVCVCACRQEVSDYVKTKSAEGKSPGLRIVHFV